MVFGTLMVHAQQSSEDIAVPFVLIAPDARAAGIGDMGVASRPDVYAIHWNAAKYAFMPAKKGVGLTYTPWLRQLADDQYLFYLSGFSRLGKGQTLAASVKYFSMGEYLLTDDRGGNGIPYTPNEWSIDAAYIMELFDFLSASVSFRLLHSGLKAVDFFEGNDNAAYGIGTDASFYYHNSLFNGDALSFGITLSNLGPEMNYGGYTYPLPTQLRLGGSYDLLQEGTRFSFTGELSRLLISVDDPGNRHSFATGIECAFLEKFMARGGYHHERNRNYFTMGLGFGLKDFNVDFSYLRSPKPIDPLQNTLRFGLSFNIIQ